MSLAILPGSYDPITLGHLDLIRRASEEYDEVVVAVMVNPAKTTMLTMAERVKLAELTVQGLPNVRVLADTGMLIDLYDRLGADAVCKGYRNETDYAYEMNMAEWNRAHNPKFETVLWCAVGDHVTLSSTEVRERLKRGGSIREFVHPDVAAYLCENHRG